MCHYPPSAPPATLPVMKKPYLVLAAAFCFLVPAIGLSAAALDNLLALMVDLPGWEADKADGADMTSQGIHAVTASRSYRSGERTFEASILIGMQAVSSWMPTYKEGYKVETPDGSMDVRKVGGFLVWEAFEKEAGSGGILVLLQEAPKDTDTGAVFAVSFTGLNREEAMKMAQRFSWPRMKEQANRMK